MKVVYLIAGAGGMYCGSCLRDNRLAATLIAQGRDVVLVPLITPIRTDETDVSQRRLYYNGINVYLQQKSTLFRSLPGWISHVLDAPVLVRFALQLAGHARPDQLGALTVSMLQGVRGAQRKELKKLIHGLRAIKPDVVNLPNLMFVGLAGPLKAALDVSVLCTLTGEDIFLDRLPNPSRQQAFDLIRERAQDVDGFVAVTDYYASFATEHFRLPAERIHVVRMGIHVDDVGPPAQPPAAPFTIGYLARICPEKGLANLCEAFALLRRAGRTCRLRAAGYLASGDRPYLKAIVARLREQGVAESFEYVGEVNRAQKFEFLRSLHVFSVPTMYHEAKGLYILEAMACGVPVAQPRHGSFPELLEATGGGLLYEPTGADALADTIARLMDDDALHDAKAVQGRAAIHESFTDEVMAEQMWNLYQSYMGRPSSQPDHVAVNPRMEPRT